MRTLTHILSKVPVECCYVVLTIMVFCVTWQVITRLIFNVPSTMLDKFTQVLFMWTILLGGAYTTGLKRHLATDLLAQKLLVASILTSDSFIQVIIMVFAVISVIYGGNIVVERA